MRGDNSAQTASSFQNRLSVGPACQSNHHAGHERISGANRVLDDHFRSRNANEGAPIPQRRTRCAMVTQIRGVFVASERAAQAPCEAASLPLDRRMATPITVGNAERRRMVELAQLSRKQQKRLVSASPWAQRVRRCGIGHPRLRSGSESGRQGHGWRGDAFMAGVMVGLTRGADTQTVLETACRLGAIVASHDGATPLLPQEMIQEFRANLKAGERSADSRSVEPVASVV